MMPHPLSVALTLALVDSLWQGAVVAAGSALVRAALGTGRPRARYVASAMSLCILVAWFAATLGGRLAVETVDLGRSLVAPALSSRWWSFASSAWSVGVVAMLARLQGGRWRLARIAARSEALPSEWASRVDALRVRSRVRARVAFRACREVMTPMAMGVFRPLVLLPLAMLSSLPPQDVELLLAHELAHVRRHDYLANLVQSVCEALLFFNPFVWCVSRWIRADRECGCDEAVVQLFPDRVRYARALEACESQRTVRSVPSLSANGGVLMSRIRFVLSGGERPHAGSSGALLCGALLGLVALGAWAHGEAASAPSRAHIDIAWVPQGLAPYREQIEAAAERHGVDADLLALMVLVESGAEASARSPAGAVGLMQVMPATAAAVARERGVEAPSPEQLADPAYNLDVGAWYLAKQFEAFGAGDVASAVAAYNAGPASVRASAQGAPLPEETQRYEALVTGLWRERDATRSEAYRNWRQAARARVLASAVTPVPEPRVSLPFGAQEDPFAGREPYAHQGVDLAQPRGTPIVSPADGVVREVFAGELAGNAVIVSHRGGLETRYYHLDQVAVRPGDPVARGSTLGTVGSKGRSTGPHLHFELRDQGTPIDPGGLVPGL